MKPVRLRVFYKTPESLLGELTRSVGRGGVRLDVRKPVPVGTRFVFDMTSPGVGDAAEVHGTVQSCTQAAPGRYLVLVRYELPQGRKGLDAVLRRVFDATQTDVKRRAPRVPLKVRATDGRPDSPVYRLRDLALGGVGIDVEADRFPSHVKVGTPFTLQMRLATGELKVRGTVAWMVTTHGRQALVASLGATFSRLSPAELTLVEDLVALRVLPAPPWIARLTFGDQT